MLLVHCVDIIVPLHVLASLCPLHAFMVHPLLSCMDYATLGGFADPLL